MVKKAIEVKYWRITHTEVLKSGENLLTILMAPSKRI